MFDAIFKGVFDAPAASVISIGDFLLCLAVALALGILLVASYTFRSDYTKSFALTLAIMPAIVCVVIMMVNGNIGAGVAVAGAFSLVRFRSVPGTAREIAAIFLAMGTGLICGMGYLGFAALFTIIMSVLFVVYNLVDFGIIKKAAVRRTLKITIPEDLDYTGAFDDLFGQYLSAVELIRVKSINLGSMFRITYNVTLKDATLEKEFIDKLRERNGNLEIMVSKEETRVAEL